MALGGAAVHAERGPRAPSVFLDIDDDLLRVGLSRLLEEEGLPVVTEPPATVVVVDSAARIPAGRRVVALYGGRRDDAIAALERGAAVVLERDSSAEVIASGIRLAAAGAAVMSADAAERLLASHRAERADPRPPGVLSPREAQVMQLLSAGHGNNEIACELMITASTVKNHVARIMEKLGARNRTDAAVIAARLELDA